MQQNGYDSHHTWQVVLLDERGQELTSEEFADLIADAGETVCDNSKPCSQFAICTSNRVQFTTEYWLSWFYILRWVAGSLER